MLGRLEVARRLLLMLSSGSTFESEGAVTIAEFLTLFDRFGSLAADLVRFVVTPSAYLRTVGEERDTSTAARLAVYAIMFAVIDLSLAGLISHSIDLSVWHIVAATFIDSLHGLVFIPAFYFTARVARHRSPFKMAVVFAFTSRFVYLTVPLVFNALFIATEDYTYALARGVAVYLFIYGSLILFAVSTTRTIKRRVGAIVVSLVAGILVQDLLQLVNFDNGILKPQATYSLLGDPIGAEIDRSALENRLTASGDSLDATVKEIHFLVTGADTAHRTPPDTVAARLQQLQAVWPVRRASLQSELSAERAHARSVIDSSSFATTRALARLEMADVVAADTLVQRIDTYLETPRGPLLVVVLDAKIALSNAEIARMRAVVSERVIRNKLVSWGMLEP